MECFSRRRGPTRPYQKEFTLSIDFLCVAGNTAFVFFGVAGFSFVAGWTGLNWKCSSIPAPAVGTDWPTDFSLSSIDDDGMANKKEPLTLLDATLLATYLYNI